MRLPWGISLAIWAKMVILGMEGFLLLPPQNTLF